MPECLCAATPVCSITTFEGVHLTQPLFQSAPTRASSSITARSHHGFFVCMAALLLATVLVGFAPSFYLRAYFGAPPLPTYLQLHGVVLTAWFLLFFVQTSLVA